MQFKYDTYGNREQTIVYLATPSRIILCALNGIDYSSGNFEGKCNDVSTISFDVNQYVETYTGQLVESNAYNWLSKFMKLYVTGIGWFIMDSPTTHGTGTKEYKTVTAQSVQSEYAQIPLDGWKVNCGTTDSLEMLVDGNVEEIEGVEFAKEQIKFYNEKNHQLSLVNILVEKVPGWKVGYVDNIPKKYKTIENGEVITKSIYLKDEIGKFDLDYSDVYSFLTQEFEKFFNCIVEFDYENLIVNFYRVENFGKNTNITIGFRNVENSNEVTIDEENIFTKIRVSGANDLGIEQCNGGSNYLFKLDKFWLNNKFLSDPTIEKYKKWETFCVQARIDYTALSKEWNIQQDKISELYIRIPTGDCDPDKWDKLSDTELLTLKKDYEAQKLGYEKLYVDEEGNFDINALNASPDANIYHQIVDTILPNIQIEIDNRKLPTSEGEKDFIEEYLTNWKYYGINELEIKLKSYQDQAKLLAKSHYDLTWERYQELSKQDPEKYPALTEDGFKDKHNIYEKNAYQMDENNKDSCAAALKARRDEVKKEEEKQKEISKKRTALSQKMSLETWSDDTLGGFSKEELSELYHITKQTPYTNENIFTTNQDSLTDIVTTQSELCRVALEELQTYSIPQTIYSTSLDNLISASGMELHAETLDYGSFIWLGLRDDYYVKLRVMSISYNPFLFDNNFSLSFSNMIKSTSNRDDFMQILGSSSNLGGESSRNNVSGNLQLSDDNIYEILNKLLQSSAFNNKVQNIVNGSGGSIIGGTGGNYITPGTLEAEMIKCIDIHAENGFFQYLQAELISVGKIVAESGDFKKLQAKVGNIDDLLAGNVSAELGHIIKLTADNVIIDEAVIRQLIASQITVSMLKAGTINADKFNIESEDGGMAIVGNTMQFKDQNGVVRIQIGRDTNNNFTFCLYDETGKGVLIDSTGIKDSAISDGLIKNDMIANNTISKEKLSFQAVEQDADGKIHVSDVIVNGQGINASFTTIENSMSDMQTQIDGIKTSTPYTMNIFSSNGTIFRPGMINTTLIPSLYLGQSDITDMYDETHFVWTRQSADSDGDHYWNAAHTNGIKNLHITSDDVLGGASFTCSFFNDDGKLITEATF
nr:MAG TPA: tail protein [Caudoviricetes sp.]